MLLDRILVEPAAFAARSTCRLTVRAIDWGEPPRADAAARGDGPEKRLVADRSGHGDPGFERAHWARRQVQSVGDGNNGSDPFLVRLGRCRCNVKPSSTKRTAEALAGSRHSHAFGAVFAKRFRKSACRRSGSARSAAMKISLAAVISAVRCFDGVTHQIAHQMHVVTLPRLRP
jgi:hypothetical protein